MKLIFKNLKLRFYRWILNNIKPDTTNVIFNAWLVDNHKMSYTTEEICIINYFIHVLNEYDKRAGNVLDKARVHGYNYQFKNDYLIVTIYSERMHEFNSISFNNIITGNDKSLNSFLERNFDYDFIIKYKYFKPLNRINYE